MSKPVNSTLVLQDKFCFFFAPAPSAVEGGGWLRIITRISSSCVCACVYAQLYPTLCNPVNYSPLDSLVYGITQ